MFHWFTRAGRPPFGSRNCSARPPADYDSVIGMEKFQPVQRFVTKMSSGRFTPATGPATLCAVFVETGSRGLATRIEPVRLGGRLKQTVPLLTSSR